MGALLALMSVHHIYAVSAETSSGNWNPGNWSYRRLLHAMWMHGIKLRGPVSTPNS